MDLASGSLHTHIERSISEQREHKPLLALVEALPKRQEGKFVGVFDELARLWRDNSVGRRPNCPPAKLRLIWVNGVNQPAGGDVQKTSDGL